MNKILAKVQCADCSTTAEITIEAVGREDRGGFKFELEASCPEGWSSRKAYPDYRGFEFYCVHVCEMCSADPE